MDLAVDRLFLAVTLIDTKHAIMIILYLFITKKNFCNHEQTTNAVVEGARSRRTGATVSWTRRGGGRAQHPRTWSGARGDALRHGAHAGERCKNIQLQ